MKAVVFEQHGGVEVLKYTDVSEPKPGPNDVVVKVQASACNYNDIWARVGMPGLPTIFPHISGSDVAGTVVTVGSDVSSVQVGDEVVVCPYLSCQTCEACARGEPYFCRNFLIYGFQTGPLDGGHAEYAKLPAYNVVPKPKNLKWEEAASLPLVLTTAWRMLVTRANIRPGQYVLVWGGGGGLGTVAIQICKLFGAHAIAVASCDTKLDKALDLGADYVINRSRQDVVKEVRRITRGDGRDSKRVGVDVVFEHVGRATWETSVAALRWGGTIVTCGATTGFDASFDIRYLWNKQLNFLGSHLGTKAELIDAMQFVESGQIQPVIHEVMSLPELGRAQSLMERDESVGKIVIGR